MRAITCAFVAAGALIMTATQAAAQKLDPPLCERSAALQAVILELSPEDDHCGNFPGWRLRQATGLRAGDKNIGDLKPGDFNDFDSLIRLDLNDNDLRRLPGNVFAGLGKLTTLTLQDNKLSVLSRDAFVGLGKLERLFMQDNRLKTLPAGVFRELGRLETLQLWGNRLEGFSVDAFDGLHRLEKLLMREQGPPNARTLRTLPGKAWLDDLDRLQVLDLSSVGLESLEVDPFNRVASNLGEDDEGRHIPGTLRQLLLRNNRLRYLPRDMFKGLDLGPQRGNHQVKNDRDEVIETITFVDGALLLHQNPGDGEPLGENPDHHDENSSGDNYIATPNEDVFTLPMYMTMLLRVNHKKSSQWRLDDIGMYMPHAAPFDLSVFWWKVTREVWENLTDSGKVEFVDAGNILDRNRAAGGPTAGRDENNRPGADVIFETKHTMSMDFDVNPQSRSNYTSATVYSRSNCGFSPCYDGFGFHSHGHYHGGKKENREKENPVITETTFVSSPADPNGYVAGEDVVVQIKFDHGPLVRFYPPSVELRIGRNNRRAEWIPTNIIGELPLRFRYRIQEGDRDSDGIEIKKLITRREEILVDGWTHYFYIENPYREAGDFIRDKNLNVAGGAGQKVQAKTYVSFVSSDAVFAKEGETVDLDLQISPAAASDLVIDFTAYRIDGIDWAHWNNYEITNSAGGDKVAVAAGETSGSIRIRIRDELHGGHDNPQPEPAREAVSFCLDRPGAGAGYERFGSCKPLIIKEGVCNRTPGVQEALMAATERGDCGDVTDEDLAMIVELDLSDRGITGLKSGDFLGLDRLKLLDLRDNQLSELSEGTFDEIKDTLTTLHLQGNRWLTLPAGMFSELSEVQSVFLHDNPGADFQLQLGVEFIGEEPDFPLAAGDEVQLRLVLAEGAPYPFQVTLPSPDNGDFKVGQASLPNAAATVSFDVGAMQSSEFTFAASEATSSIEITVGGITRTDDECPVKGENGRCFSGLDIVAAEKFRFGGVRLKIRVFLENALE